MKKFTALVSFLLLSCCFSGIGWTWPVPLPHTCTVHCPPEFLHVTVTLENAEIKALPSLWQTIVPAPGPGKKNVFVTSSLEWRTDILYTNWLENIADSHMGLFYGDGVLASSVTNFLPSLNGSAVLIPLTRTLEGMGWSPAFTKEEVENLPLKIGAFNVLGNLTGGRHGVLTITVYYFIDDVN